MNEIIQQLLGGSSSEWISKLTGQLGFSGDQAGSFVSSLIGKLGGLVSGGGLDIGQLLSGGSADDVASKLDVNELAQEAGVDADQAGQGLSAILPDLLEKAKSAAGSSDLLDKLGGGDLGDIASKLF